MTQQQYDAALARLDRLRQRIELWRGTRSGRAPMPPELWEQAAALVHQLGISAVQRALRLNARSLRQRLAATANPPAPEAPRFVQLEMTPTPGSTAGAVLELSDTTGVTLKLLLPAGSALDLARVIEAFRGGRS